MVKACMPFFEKTLPVTPGRSLCCAFRVNWHKVINGIFIALFLVVGGWSGLFFLQLHRDLTATRAREAENLAKLTAAQARLDQQRRYLEQLRHDPVLVEKVIRQKLGYVRSEEFVFRFDDSARP